MEHFTLVQGGEVLSYAFFCPIILCEKSLSLQPVRSKQATLGYRCDYSDGCNVPPESSLLYHQRFRRL